MADMFRLEIFVEDTKLGKVKRALAGLAHIVKDQPVVNARKAPNGELKEETNGNLLGMFAAYLKKQHITKISPLDVRHFLTSVGRSAKSYSYLLNQAKKAKMVRRIGKSNSYKVVS